MKRQLLLLAVLTGCGAVQSSMSTDGGGSSSDALPGTLANGCVLRLQMDEASWSGVSNEVKDSCGSNNGTVSGTGTTTVADGVRGRAGSFTGGGCIDIVNSPQLHGATGLTLSAWIFPTQLNGGNNANGVISKREDADVQSEYSLSVWIANHVYVALDGDDARINGQAVISTNSWAQLTMVYDATRTANQRVAVFINGSPDTPAAGSPAQPASIMQTPSDLHVGCMPAPASDTQQNFIGELDEVVIWNRALTTSEVTQWYAATKP